MSKRSDRSQACWTGASVESTLSAHLFLAIKLKNCQKKISNGETRICCCARTAERLHERLINSHSHIKCTWHRLALTVHLINSHSHTDCNWHRLALTVHVSPSVNSHARSCYISCKKSSLCPYQFKHTHTTPDIFWRRLHISTSYPHHIHTLIATGTDWR